MQVDIRSHSIIKKSPNICCSQYCFFLNFVALLNPKTTDHDTTGKTKYIKKCFDLGINPVSYFVKNLENKELKLRFHGLGAESVKAISFPLEVSVI